MVDPEVEIGTRRSVDASGSMQLRNKLLGTSWLAVPVPRRREFQVAAAQPCGISESHAVHVSAILARDDAVFLVRLSFVAFFWESESVVTSSGRASSSRVVVFPHAAMLVA